MLGPQLGAGMYENRVLVSLWASDPPRSVNVWKEQLSRATLRPDAGRAFWMFTRR
jgi:hypothetical protein